MYNNINTDRVKKNNGDGHIVDHLLNNPLPYNDEVEASLLSAIIINNNHLDDIDLNPSYFYNSKHQTIAKGILSLQKQSIPIDLVMLVCELREKGWLGEDRSEHVTAAYVASLVDYVPLAVNVQYYWNKIKELYQKREDIKRANLIIQGSVSPGSVSDSELSRLKQELIENSCRLHVESFTAADLEKEDLPDPVWVVPGIIPEGLSILGGKPKKGKSIFALNVALSVASGGKALDMPEPVTRGTVLYLSFEDKKKRLKNRIGPILGCSGWPAGLIFYTRFPKMGKGGLQALESEIKKHNATFVVIDTLARFRPSAGKQNMYLDDYSYMSQIRELSSRTGCSILLVHHLRKSGAADSGDIFDCFSGSNGITGSVDCMLALTRSKGSPNSTLSVSGNDVGDQDYALEYNETNFRWSLLGESSQIQNSDQKQVLYDLFSDNPGDVFSPKQIAELTGLDYGYIRKTLPVFVADGSVIKKGRGKYIFDDGINDGINHITIERFDLPFIDPVDPIDPDNEQNKNDDSGINGINGNKHHESSLDSDSSDCSINCSHDDTGNKNDDTGNIELEILKSCSEHDDLKLCYLDCEYRIGNKIARCKHPEGVVRCNP